MAKLKNIREYIKAPSVKEIGHECHMCGERFGTHYRGHWYVCGNQDCKNKADDLLREDRDDQIITK